MPLRICHNQVWSSTDERLVVQELFFLQNIVIVQSLLYRQSLQTRHSLAPSGFKEINRFAFTSGDILELEELVTMVNTPTAQEEQPGILIEQFLGITICMAIQLVR